MLRHEKVNYTIKIKITFRLYNNQARLTINKIEYIFCPKLSQ